MITANEIKRGTVINLDGDLLEVVERDHVKPGKGPAFLRILFKNIRTGAQFERTFNTNIKFEDVRIDENPGTFAFSNGDEYTFMDSSSYEQITLTRDVLGDLVGLLKEECEVKIYMNGEEVLKVELPLTVVLEVTETEPGMRGDTVSNTTKPAKVETGAFIQVPLFVDIGDKIKIDTRTLKYLERAK